MRWMGCGLEVEVFPNGPDLAQERLVLFIIVVEVEIELFTTLFHVHVLEQLVVPEPEREAAQQFGFPKHGHAVVVEPSEKVAFA